MRAAQLPNSDSTVIALFLTLLGHEIIKMTIFQPRRKKEFPRQLLNQPASGRREVLGFFSFWFPCATKFDSSISPEDVALWTMKSSPRAVLWHTAQSAREKEQKSCLSSETSCQKAKFRQILPNWAFFSPQVYAGENSHMLCWQQQQTSSSINILINIFILLVSIIDINQTNINALWGKAIFVRK